MAPLKCCVIGCDSTSNTQRLFCMPMNDHLRNLWMSLLAPANPYLLGLTKSQLMRKRVCQRHFDRTQFDQTGVRIRHSYPCLFTEKEILHGVPLSSEDYNVLNEHSYCRNQEDEDDTASQEPAILMGMPGDVLLQEHLYTLPSTSEMTTSTKSKEGGDNLLQEHLYTLPSTSQMRTSTKSREQDDILQRHLDSLPSTSEIAVSEKSEDGGISVPRRPLMEISQNINVETALCQTPLPSISKKRHIAKTSSSDISQKSSADTTLLNPPKQSTSKGTSTIKQFKAKTRRFIKETTKIAADSLGQTATERLQNACDHARLDIMQNFEKLNKKAKAFLLMQLRLARKNKMARRFTFEDKLFALALMKQSPKGYKLLENIFALPTKRTLARLAAKIVFESGINKTIFDHIKHSIKNWDTKKRLCSLVFDEVALTPHLIYNESKDIINGFEEIAGERRQKFADHALVFMIRGICSSWRQSIAYYFCAGTVSAVELEKILKELIPRLSEAGLKPLALVCDQGSTFRSCFKNLRATTARLQTAHDRPHDTVHVAGHDLFVFHDSPHLLKSIRNNFLDKDIIFDGKRASWEDILYVYDLDLNAVHTRALPTLTADHVDPKRIKKMRVKMAAQVLSARTGAMLEYTDNLHKRLNKPKETMGTTAALVFFFDELFDSVNGSPGQGKGKLRCAVKENSVHAEFWRMALKKNKNIKYVDNSSKLARRTGEPRHVRVPCLDGWITTLNSFLGLSKLLFSEYKVEYFYPRFINQDPLENFFGRIRAINYRNVNPDVNTFIYSFKSLVLSNILTPQSKVANCEDDDGETLIDLSYLFSTYGDEKENLPPKINFNTPSSSSLTQFREESNIKASVIAERVKVQTSAYTAGYVCRKITKKFGCKACAKTYTTKEHEGIHEYIRYREYKRLKNSNLVYPNARILCLYRECAQIVHNYLNVECHQPNVKINITAIINRSCDLSWLGCKDHGVGRYFVSLMCRLHVHNWCNIINRIFNGKVEEKYVLKMHTMHQAAFKKYKAHRLTHSRPMTRRMRHARTLSPCP